MSLRYASVCDGIGAVHVAWQPLGWRCAWTSEIEPFPAAVVEHHWHLPNLGDMTCITEQQLEQHGAIDLLVGGTPCQSFSVAGLRGGLADPRGNLALRFCQLAAILRPRWLLWENVPGVLSSNGGRDFGSILGAMVELGYGVAYRVLDAQYVRVDRFRRAVPQRRRRVFVVGHLGDWRRAAAVLFEPKSLRGDSAPRRTSGQGVARDVAASLRSGGAGASRVGDTRGQDNVVASVAGCFWNGEQVTQTLDAVLAKRQTMPEKNRFPAVIVPRHDGSPCVDRGPDVVVTPIDMRQASRGEKMTNNRREGSSGGAPGTGIGNPGDPSPSLSMSHPPAVAFTQNQCGDVLTGEVAPSMGTNSNATGRNTPKVMTHMAVRRLTPRECERLQAFPDNYTAITYRGKPAADGPRYKALGNSMACNVMAWIGRRIAMVDKIGGGK